MANEFEHLLGVLKARFEKHMKRHPRVSWDVVEARLLLHPEKWQTLLLMESTGGEPDVVELTLQGQVVFMDCAPETPKGRRSYCYDEAALNARKENKPASSVEKEVKLMGATLLTEERYRLLQSIEPVDQKTSSWIATPADVRSLGGALFGDYRYGRVFVYHNGADSYYGARAFRVEVTV